MKLSDEQIRSIMQKEGCSKTILVDNDKVQETISKHKKENWKLIKKTEISGRTKLTFEK